MVTRISPEQYLQSQIKTEKPQPITYNYYYQVPQINIPEIVNMQWLVIGVLVGLALGVSIAILVKK